MSTPEQRRELLDRLDEIEAEMKSIGFWVDDPPSEGNFLEIDFAEWLQGVFLPKARERIRNDDLPDRSQVGLMAMRQYDYMGTVEEALPLVSMLHRFDDLVQKAASPPRRKARKKKPKKKS